MVVPVATEREINDALRSVELWKRRDPVAFVKANKFQERLFRACRDPKPESITVVLALKPNRVGGSFGVMNLWSAIMYGSENNETFRGSPFGKDWPFIKAARLFSTSQNIEDVGALQIAMKQVFPIGKYEQSRGTGKGYNSAGKSTVAEGQVGHGWTWDAFTFGQDALSAAGATKGLVICSEPPPRPLFTECITRLSGNGLLLVECVQMDLAPWLEEMAEEAGGKEVDGVKYGTLRLDGKVVGEVRVVRGDVEDACREHSNGHMAHSAIEAMVALWPEEEREARRTGKPLKLSGRILPNWGDANEIEEIPEWHSKQADLGEVVLTCMLDPHDRKPWALAWFATYPNDGVIVFQEWPDFDFAACKASPVSELEEYRAIILGKEEGIGLPVDNRIIDKLFGNTPGKGTALTLKKMLAKPCYECQRHVGRTEYEDLDERSAAYLEAERACKHRLVFNDGVAYPGSVNQGHILMRNVIGNPAKKIRPKLFALKPSTPNFCRGMRRYAWKENSEANRENTGDSEKPQLVNKDFPDLAANFLHKKLNVFPKDAPPPPRVEPKRLWTPRSNPIAPSVPMSGTPRDARPRFK